MRGPSENTLILLYALPRPLTMLLLFAAPSFHASLNHMTQSDYSSSHSRQLRAAAAAAAAAGAAAAPHIAHGWGTFKGSSGGGWGRGSAAAAAEEGFGVGADDPRSSSSSSGSRRRSWLSMPQQQSGGALWMGGAAQGVSFDSVSPWGSFGGVDVDRQMRELRMQPGQAHTPVRVGGEGLGPLLFAGAAAPAAERGSSSSGSEGSSSSSGGFGAVVSAAANRHFSVAATASGEVWTFGACFNGALGSGEGVTW
jgi:hypothetical protein